MKRKKYAQVMVGLMLAAGLISCQGGRPGTAKGVKVTDIEVGRSVAADKTIADETDSFQPSDTIYVSVKTDGSAPSATLTARFTYEDGQLVDESKQDIVASGGTTVTEFHVSKPDGWPAGDYKVEVLLNGTPAGTKDFKVS
jgi:hypothetical protein